MSIHIICGAVYSSLYSTYVLCIYHAGESDFGGNLFATTTPISSRLTTTVFVTPFKDRVTLKGIETGILRLVLALGSSQPPGTFFKRDLAVPVNDTTCDKLSLRLEKSMVSLIESYPRISSPA